ncbi:MAG: hypothetical protein AAGH82_11530, partial [Pseudomonadota bacterium]
MKNARHFLITLFVSLGLLTAPAWPAWAQDAKAETKASQPQFKPIEGRTERLDGLFADLKRERDPAKARRISNRIWIAWSSWDDDSIDLLMRRTSRAIDANQLPMALDILDQVVALAPDYAEAWNRRATVHFMRGDFELSIADVEQTLALEPRHFGALTGLAQMMQALDENERAITALQQALNVYPAMEGPKQALIRLLEETEGE